MVTAGSTPTLVGQFLAAVPDAQVHALVEMVADFLASTEASEAWTRPEPEREPTPEARARAAMEAELARLEEAGAGDAFAVPAGLAPWGDDRALASMILPPSTFAPAEPDASDGDRWRPRRSPPPLLRSVSPAASGSSYSERMIPAALLGALLLVPRVRAGGQGATWEALVASLGSVGDPRVAPALCLMLADARPEAADDDDWLTDVERAVANHRVAKVHHLALGSLPLELDAPAREELEAAAAAEIAALADELAPAVQELFKRFVTS